MALKDITKNDDILSAVQTYELVDLIALQQVPGFNPKQDERDRGAIMAAIRSAETNTKDFKICNTTSAYCEMCLAERRYKPRTRGSRYHKKGSADIRKPIFYIPAVKVNGNVIGCVVCFMRMKPQIVSHLTQRKFPKVDSIAEYVPEVVTYETDVGVIDG